MTLIVPPQQGHNMWPGFFQCPELVDFVIANGENAAGGFGLTRTIADLEGRPAPALPVR